MRTLNEYIEIIRKCSDMLRSYFGVTSLRIFGSVARNEQNEDSDIDVCVDMKPNLFLHVELKKFLEEQFGCPVDVVRIHKNMNEFLKRQIEKDGILVSL
uniref:nucleotidyltransferase family protein n=1 Tax=uncultured Bacteroides sp. TaxID=162156 RepID=UPI00280B6E85|nr:nucleotidyltransferase family protein [uncultured Bacteroides sp.]